MIELPTVCPLDCPDRCSMVARVDGDRVISLDGTRANPWTDGYICGKVRRFPARVHGDLRIRQPMLRDGDDFRPISWDDAIARIAAEWRAIVAESGPAAILPYWYAGSNGWLTGGGLDVRLWNRMGTTRIDRTFCAANTKAGTTLVYGDLPSADQQDVEHASLALLWGVNPSASGIHLVPRIRDLKKRGGKLIVVDPRRTPLAAEADLHLRPLPGTDVALALGVAHVAFAEDLADREFLAAHSADAAAFEAHVAAFTPEAAGAIAGVDPSAIRELARMYAASSPAFLRCGWGLERNRNGTDGVRAVTSLPAIFGKFGVRGGGFCLSTSGGYGVDAKRWQEAPGSPPPGRIVNMSQLGRILEETRDPPIRSVYVYDCNPVATAPDQQRVVEQLRRPDRFVVVHEQVWTDTCDVADLVLPATTFLEHEELVRSYSSYSVQWGAPVIPPVGQAWSNHRVLQAIARALGYGDEPAFRVTPRELATEMLAQLGGDLPGLERETIRHFPRPVQYADVSRRITLAGDTPPRWRPPLSAEPLILVSPATPRAVSSTGYEALAAGTARVELHPDDAAARGLLDGDVARVHNAHGAVELLVAVNATNRPGVVSIPKGLWRSATRNGWTSNALVSDHVDELGGGACYNDARVEITRLGPGAAVRDTTGG